MLNSGDVSDVGLGRGDNPPGTPLPAGGFSGWFSLSDRNDLDGFVVLHQRG